MHCQLSISYINKKTGLKAGFFVLTGSQMFVYCSITVVFSTSVSTATDTTYAPLWVFVSIVVEPSAAITVSLITLCEHCILLLYLFFVRVFSESFFAVCMYFYLFCFVTFFTLIVFLSFLSFLSLGSAGVTTPSSSPSSGSSITGSSTATTLVASAKQSADT